VGAPHWPVLALVTFILGMLQVGPILVWVPLAIWLWSGGETGLALFMVAWGLIAIGLVDNLVKTAVVSRGAQLPAILAFLGAIGGLITWGIVGIFLGPVIVAVSYQIVVRWLRDDRPPAIG
jgi:predicted PurR-regulated permease PerM